MPQLDLSPKPQDHSNLQCRLQVEDRNEALRLKAESETPEARREKQLADPWRNGSCPESKGADSSGLKPGDFPWGS